MGQKVNPIGLRLGINRTWDSRWFADGDLRRPCSTRISSLRKMHRQSVWRGGRQRMIIERPAEEGPDYHSSARPGVVIGKKGADIEKLAQRVAKMTVQNVSLNIVEVRKPEIDAKLVADNIAQQLERRVAFPARHEACGAERACVLVRKGVRINVGGRLGRRRNRADRMVSRRSRAVAHAACRYRLRRGDSPDAYGALWREGLGFTRRDHGA